MPNVTIDTEMPSAAGLENNGGGITSWSFFFNNAAGSLLTVGSNCTAAAAERTTTAVTYDSVALSTPTGAAVRSGWSGTLRRNEASLWQLASPATGNKQVAFTYSGACDQVCAAALTVSNWDTAAANVRTKFDNDAAISPISYVHPSTTWGGLVVSWYQTGTSISSTWERLSAATPVDDSFAGGNGRLCAMPVGGGPVGLSGTLGASDWAGLVSLEIVPAALTPAAWVDQRERSLLAPSHLQDDGLC